MALLQGLHRVGVHQLVLSPGSRSTPIVIAAQQLAWTLIPILDERSAAFFALGLAQASQCPVALLATSGSAPAHWYPAVIEAAEWGTPLILISADRPALLRDWGANQTIDQQRLFGHFVREFHNPSPAATTDRALKAQYALGWRLAWRSISPCPGPVHVNLAFEEPLVPTGRCQPWQPAPQQDARTFVAPVVGDNIRGSYPQLWSSGRGVIIAGPGAIKQLEHPHELWNFATKCALPVLTDPLSGLRFGTDENGHDPQNRILSYDVLARNEQIKTQLRPDWILRLGRLPVSKALTQWLTGIPTWSLTTPGSWHDPTHDVVERFDMRFASFAHLFSERQQQAANQPWLECWIQVEQRLRAFAQRYLKQAPWQEGQLLRALLQIIPAGEALLCANSLPIRQLETWPLPRSAALTVFGNRGVSGIDGQISTLAGLNQSGMPTWGLVGDLSFCHDLTGLFLATHLQRPLLIINNGGGRIFDTLPQVTIPDFQRLWRTPQPIDVQAVAQLFRIPYRLVSSLSACQQLADLATTPALVEVQIDAEQSLNSHREFWQHAQPLAQCATMEAGHDR
jgi:2-succinyl-5-enolpyruvyl-6-hydroxy-3-cyclohexene-1-carboxylate synthase